MDVKKIAAKIAASKDPQAIWDAMQPTQKIYEAVWQVPGDEDTIIVIGGTEAELKALAKQGKFSLRTKEAVSFETFKKAVTG